MQILQINNLQDTVQKKDLEMSGMEERYKKYIEKAKSVIKTLDPKQGSGPGGPEVTVLRTQINEKDKLIETLEHVSRDHCFVYVYASFLLFLFLAFQETEKARAVREMEERLISSAFYNLSMQMHRNAVESRLGHVNASGAPGHGTGGGPGQAHHGSAQTGQSFLARQRQVQQQASAGKGKGGYHGNNDFLDY